MDKLCTCIAAGRVVRSKFKFGQYHFHGQPASLSQPLGQVTSTLFRITMTHHSHSSLSALLAAAIRFFLLTVRAYLRRQRLNLVADHPDMSLLTVHAYLHRKRLNLVTDRPMYVSTHSLYVSATPALHSCD